MLYRTGQVLVSIVVILLLTGCGFHLRQQALLPTQLQHLYLQSNAPYGEFTLALRQSLMQQNVTLATQTTHAPYTLNVLSTAFTATIPPYSTTNQATPYHYTYNVNFALSNDKQVTIAGPFSVSLTRTLIVNAGETLYSTDAVNRLESQMINDAISQMFLILGSTNVRQILVKTAYETQPRST